MPTILVEIISLDSDRFKSKNAVLVSDVQVLVLFNKHHEVSFVTKQKQICNKGIVWGVGVGGGGAQFVTIGLPTTSLIVSEKYYM